MAQEPEFHKLGRSSNITTSLSARRTGFHGDSFNLAPVLRLAHSLQVSLSYLLWHIYFDNPKDAFQRQQALLG